MQPRINVITLGTKDLVTARAFYEQGLGWKASSISNEHFVALQLQGIVLLLYPQALLAEDAMAKETSVEGDVVKGFRGITLSHNVSSKEEVDSVLNQAVQAGAKLERQAQDVFWGGYRGYFSDPDGHFWEVAWNPHWALLSNGMLELPR